MHDLPFALPESLASYLIQYETSPDKTIRRLEKHLQKRGPDAVGYFLLGWFYHQEGSNDEAIDCALKAKTFAPGSPFFSKVHYYFTHPKVFQAWENDIGSRGVKKGVSYKHDSQKPISDLDTLIERLSAMESSWIRNNDNEDIKERHHNPSATSDDTDDIVSETLAKIHEQQGKNEAAINTYQQLKNKNPDKSSYYNEQIERLQNIIKEENQ